MPDLKAETKKGHSLRWCPDLQMRRMMDLPGNPNLRRCGLRTNGHFPQRFLPDQSQIIGKRMHTNPIIPTFSE
jgi:hypothetical protein